MLEVWW